MAGVRWDTAYESVPAALRSFGALRFTDSLLSLTLPQSMTNTTSSIVMDVSAMLVARTTCSHAPRAWVRASCFSERVVEMLTHSLTHSLTLRTPGGGVENVRRCSSLVSVECSGMSKNSGRSVMLDASMSCSVRISAMPGRNTRMAPSSYWHSTARQG